jgi:hypothetical protein
MGEGKLPMDSVAQGLAQLQTVTTEELLMSQVPTILALAVVEVGLVP